MANFIDLFCGLGGFHIALKELGHECVFACEIDQELREVYFSNFGLFPYGDIRKVAMNEIPSHDILCAGFPCQPFSKAGNQKGFDHPELGSLYQNIFEIIEYHQPNFIILENVSNLVKHKGGDTLGLIRKLLEECGYEVDISRLSPHQFNIPQIRNRVYIIGSRVGLSEFDWPEPISSKNETSIFSILEKKPKNPDLLTTQDNLILDIWQEFLDHIPENDLIPHPVWAMEFGANYPYVRTTPSQMLLENLKKYRGALGRPLNNSINMDEIFAKLPSYARRNQIEFPSWKVKYIQRNREFYKKNKKWIDIWIPKLYPFPQSYQKLEWNVGTGERNIRKYIIQKRPSGIRVKNTTTSPSLIAMTKTQLPFFPWENRYITPEEGLRLQSMQKLKYLPKSKTSIFKALGNAVNVEIVKLVAAELLRNNKTGR